MARIKYWDPESGEWKYADSSGGSGGKSAYQYAREAGYDGTEEEFAQKLAEDAQGSMEPAEDDIPKIFFGDALQQTKDEKVVSFRYISKTQDISGYAEIKAQGNSSMSYAKKNQTVKLFKDAACEEKLKVDFKGWGKQNKHCYKANWIDLSHARNVVSARLWGDIVKSRANYAELPELLRTSPNQGAIDGFPVKVYAAGVYQGRYTLNIPKDAWMANMDKDNETHCILCGEGYTSGCFLAANVNEWTDEVHDTMPNVIKTRWIEIINFVMNSTDEEFKANLGDYFYVESLIDYHLFGLASCGIDAYGKNQLYMTYDGQKWLASMYDMDSTWGLFWHGGTFVATDYPRTSYEDYAPENNKQGNLLYIRLEQLFKEELQARWAELKNGALSIDNVINRFERFTDIAPAELVKEDYASTTGDGKFTGIPQQGKNNIQQLRGFALARIAWTDKYIAGLTGEVEPDEPEIPDAPTSVPCTGISLSASELTFTAEGAQILTATVEPDNTTDTVIWSSDAPDIASVENGVVTANGNGNAMITATCGAQTASCAVSVSGIVDTAVYSMSETMFDGTEATIDTGIKLQDEVKDYTVFVDFTPVNAAESVNYAEYKVINAEHVAYPWPGWKIEGVHTTDETGRKCIFSGDSTDTWPWDSNLGNRHKFVLRHSGGSFNFAKEGATSLTAVADGKINTTAHNATMKIADGKYVGTIHSVKVWFEAKSDDFCLNLVNS